MKPLQKKDTFIYFAYGSNLLKKRIHINNPSAEFLGNGRLSDHRLDFMTWGPRWRGAVASIYPAEGASVWGAIWKIDIKDMPALDKQEGVDTNWYFAKTVEVFVPEKGLVECRTYQLSQGPPPFAELDDLPEDRRPSKTYLDVIITGAVECNLPESYIQKLKTIKHNGNEATAETLAQLATQQPNK